MPPPRDDTIWYQAHASDVLAEQGVDPEQGLSQATAEARLERWGANRLRQARSRPLWRLLLDQFASTVVLVLVAAEGVALAFGHWVEAIAIAAVLIVNAALGFFTEWRATRAMDALRDMGRASSRVRRDGTIIAVDDAALVPGDVLVIEGGDAAPADARLIRADGMRVDESALTGESEPARKDPATVPADTPLADRTNMLYKGTVLTSGSGEAVIIATGMRTELGRIAGLVESAEAAATPLQRRLDHLGRRLAGITIATAVVIAVVGLLLGQEPARMIETAIALGVAAIPEGLPIVATIALARGTWSLARRNALINQLPAVETLGATHVIMTDKTGTLTENRMRLARVVTPEGVHEWSDDEGTDRAAAAGPNEAGAPGSLLRRVLVAGVLCNNASWDASGPEDLPDEHHGDPTEVALVRAAAEAGIDPGRLRRDHPEEREEAFDPEAMMMATYHRTDGGLRVAVKGAPQAVLAHCTQVGDPGAATPMTDADRTQWIERSETLAADGTRVLAVAEKTARDVDDPPYERLTLLGLVALADPPRPGVREAVQSCRAAGITVVLVTGDHAATARAIALRTGIADEPAADVVEGRDLRERFSETPRDSSREPAAEDRRLLDARVFARVDPEQKLDLVEAFQRHGFAVAMTGDGVNDAPALKKADIGIAMGRRGTDAARQAAAMILKDDAFETIVAAVQQGRVVFANIRRAVVFMLCTNLAEVIAVTVASVAGAFTALPLPLLPLQILYLNVLTDVFPALALGMGKGDAGVMKQPPRARGEAILRRDHWTMLGGWATLLAACVLGASAVATFLLGAPRLEAITISFLTLAFGKLWFVFELRAPGPAFSGDLTGNPYLWAALALCVTMLLAAVYLPGLAGVLRTEPLAPLGWGLVLAASAVPFVVGQLRRMASPAATA